ncbi:MAG: FIST N-terminal domain-containing protein [Pseudomonadota bacterium]|nr:FIST N-terminal domain-containing protein [Pseudomonadota bacterium]
MGQLDAATLTQGYPADVLRTVHLRHDDLASLSDLSALMRPDEMELIVLFVSSMADFDAVLKRVAGCCEGTHVIGCSTAGEISPDGYAEGEIVAVGFPRDMFRAKIHLIPDLDDIPSQHLIDRMIQSRGELEAERPDWRYEFNFVVIDGLSKREDALTSGLAMGLGPVPLFGGSAGDGTDFEETFVLYDGEAYRNAAVLAQFRTRCPVRVFKTDHLIPSDTRMVVTGADPARRTVHEINAEPAAREYARILGKDPEQLTTFTFAAHPVVVRIGGQHHVRAIQRVAENGELVFFSAIDEGLVLTLAEPENMIDHLRRELGGLSDERRPANILGCDCLLRRMEAQENQMTHEISALLREHRVIGFSTYGEQYNSMHVNQTLTGVAIYPPEEDAP